MYCGSEVLSKADQTARYAVTLRCRSWCCPDCAPQRQRQLIAEAHRGRPNLFITITSRRHEAVTPEQAAKDLSWAWSVLRKRAHREARRDIKTDPIPFGAAPPAGWTRDAQGRVARQVQIVGHALEFLAVIEKHQSGWPHLHLLARAIWIDQAWLSAQMLDLIGSPVVWIERITRRSKAAAYVAKYCSKAAAKIGNAKRYWQSRGYQLVPRPTRHDNIAIAGGWERDRRTLNQWCAMWSTFGWLVERLDVRSAVARAPP